MTFFFKTNFETQNLHSSKAEGEYRDSQCVIRVGVTQMVAMPCRDSVTMRPGMPLNFCKQGYSCLWLAVTFGGVHFYFTPQLLTKSNSESAFSLSVGDFSNKPWSCCPGLLAKNHVLVNK